MNYRDFILWASVIVPLVGLAMAVRGRIWQWGAGIGFALWLLIQSVGNLISHQIATGGNPTYPVGLTTLVLQVGALFIALRGLTNDRTQHKRLAIAVAIYLVAFAIALTQSDFSRDAMRYLFRSPYTLLVAFGCGYAFIERTSRASLAFWDDGARVALVGVLVAVVPVLLLEMGMYAVMAAGDMDAARIVSRVRSTTLVLGYALVAYAFRNPWTFARSG